MELRHLRYFVAVAEEQSFTRAAERLWIAQPGLSQQIRALERELGVTLFERLSRGVVLTEPGRLFLDKAQMVLAAADEALATGRDAGAGLIGNLRIGLGTQARADIWPRAIAAFAARRPEVDVTVMEAHCDTLLRDVRDGRLDAAIVLGPVAVPGLRSELVDESRVHVALSRRHRLAACEQLTARDLDGQVVAVSGDRGAAKYDGLVRGLLHGLCVRHDLLPAGYGPALLAPVLSGAAVALVPASAGPPARDVVLRPLEPASSFRFELARPAGVTSAVLDGFADTCTATFGELRARRSPSLVAPLGEHSVAS
jgi:DNA-binding transcriptional LysR family regulator